MDKIIIHDHVPGWIKWPYTLMTFIVVGVYWTHYGPHNFLWFSDIAMIVMVPALLLPSRLLASMMAISVLFLETIWMMGFFSGGYLFHIADYMFDETLPLWLRSLSLFHFPMPAVIIYMLWRFGYDPRALKYQAVVAAFVLPMTRYFAPLEENINWVIPPDFVPNMPLPLYLLGMWIILICVVYWPSHLVFKKYCPAKM